MNDLKKFDIATSVTDSLIDLFDTMMSMELVLSDEEADEVIDSNRIVGSVSMAGKVLGSIIIQFSEEFSKIVTAAMLGIELDDIEGFEEVKDVVNEVCNIVGGSLKSNFCDAGLICELAPPAFITGTDFKIESLNTDRHESYTFTYQEHKISVIVGVKISEGGENDQVFNFKQLENIEPEILQNFDIKSNVSKPLIDVFDSMLSMELVLSEDSCEIKTDAESIAGTVSFIGPLMGSINLIVSKKFSRQITSSMLGMDDDEEVEEDEIKDVVSELCNIVGGNLKSKFCDAGMMCELSTPSFTAGSDFVIESKDMTRREIFVYHKNDETVYVEIGLRSAELMKEKSDEDNADENMPESVVSQDDIDALISSQIEQGEKKSEPQPVELVEEDDDVEDKLDFILDIPLEISVEIGSTRMKISQLLDVARGSVIDFIEVADEPVNILINDILIAKGEVIVEKEKYGVRIKEITSRIERIRAIC